MSRYLLRILGVVALATYSLVGCGQGNSQEVRQPQIKVRLVDDDRNGQYEEVYLCFQDPKTGRFERSTLFRPGQSPQKLNYDACLGNHGQIY